MVNTNPAASRERISTNFVWCNFNLVKKKKVKESNLCHLKKRTRNIFCWCNPLFLILCLLHYELNFFVSLSNGTCLPERNLAMTSSGQAVMCTRKKSSQPFLQGMMRNPEKINWDSSLIPFRTNRIMQSSHNQWVIFYTEYHLRILKG